MTDSAPDYAGSAPAGFRVSPDAADLTRIAAVTGELAAAETLADIATVVAEHIADAVHASVSTLMLREGAQLRMIGQRGVAEQKAARWSTFGVQDLNPASEAVRTRRPVVAATAAEVAARYPAMAADTPVSRSVIALPLRAATEVVGAIGLTFERNWDPGRSELDLLITFADACAEAVRRVQANVAATAAAERMSFLAAASFELAKTLDYRETLSNVARLAVPRFADWCTVDLLEHDALKTLAVAHADPERLQWALELRSRHPLDMADERGVVAVAKTGRSHTTTAISEEALARYADDGDELAALRALEIQSSLIVPLVGRERTLGVITLLRSAGRTGFDDDDRIAAEDLGLRAGLAIENATVHRDALEVADALRQAVMPTQVAGAEPWVVAAEYRPNGSGEVGGDFYDSVPLGDGRLVVVIGDVAGHGIEAAAAMAHVRAAVRALLTIDPDPRAVITALDRMFDRLLMGPLVSLVYALVEENGNVLMANAGHCPPLVVAGNGRVAFLPEAGRPPIGAGGADVPTTSLSLSGGETLLLYTDGLIERRSESIDAGLQRLAATGDLLMDDDELPAALVRLLHVMHAEDSADDVAVMALRRAGRPIVGR